MYVVTNAGREAWESQDAAIPEEYRYLLWRIDVQGDKAAIMAFLAEHPQQLVQDWLRELEELRLLKAQPGNVSADITLPVALGATRAADAKAGEAAAAALSGAGAYLAPARPSAPARAKPASETTILIVEDDPDQLALADLRVSSANYQVRTAMSVAELMRSLRQGAPDLMLLDVMLPDGNGFDVLAGLRRHPSFAALPIVMLTVVREAAHIARGLALGADGYVTKPYSKSIVVGVIRGVLW